MISRAGVRGKYAKRYAEGSNVVMLDPDVARMFPNRDSVNETLRAVAQIIQLRERRRSRAKKTAVPERRSVMLRKEAESSRSNGGR